MSFVYEYDMTDIQCICFHYSPIMKRTLICLEIIKKKKRKECSTYFYMLQHLFLDFSDVQNSTVMSSSQQEFLFFDTIVHDGEIEQVMQNKTKDSRFEFICFLFRFFKSMKSNSINQFILMKFVLSHLAIM